MSANASELSGGERGALTVAAVLATFMQGMNASIPNAALTHMQAGLSMADDEAGWLFTGYLLASILAIAITPWLASRFGRKLVLEIALIIFTIGVVLDTVTTSTIPNVVARTVQGAGGGTMVPLSFSILMDVWPPARRPWIPLWLSAVVLAGLGLGPSIGGWFSEYHGWHSIYYISLPMAGYILLAAALLLPEKKAPQPPPFDFFGFGAFALAISGLQLLLDRGERLEWFDSPEIWIEALAAALGFYLFIVQILTAKTHFFEKELLKNRNFVVSLIAYFAVGFVLLPTLALTSPMLEELLNYPVDTTGYVTIPRALALVASLVGVGIFSRRYDSRIFLAAGLTITAYANWRMLGYSPEMDWQTVTLVLLMQGIGLGMTVPSLARTALGGLDPKVQQQGTAIFNLTRLYGGTIGVAIVQLYFYSNIQSMHLALAKDLAPYRAAAHVSGAMARPSLAMLNDMITGQAGVVSIIGQFKILFCAALVALPLAVFLRKPVPLVT